MGFNMAKAFNAALCSTQTSFEFCPACKADENPKMPVNLPIARKTAAYRTLEVFNIPSTLGCFHEATSTLAVTSASSAATCRCKTTCCATEKGSDSPTCPFRLRALK